MNEWRNERMKEWMNEWMGNEEAHVYWTHNWISISKKIIIHLSSPPKTKLWQTNSCRSGPLRSLGQYVTLFMGWKHHLWLEKGFNCNMMLINKNKPLIFWWFLPFGVIWWFPKIRLPPVVMHFNGIFHEINHQFGGTPIYGNLHLIIDISQLLVATVKIYHSWNSYLKIYTFHKQYWNRSYWNSLAIINHTSN